MISAAVSDLVENWEGSRIQVLHLTGEGNVTPEENLSGRSIGCNGPSRRNGVVLRRQ